MRTKDNFCRQCGQQNHDLRVPVKHLLLEALEGFIHFDSKSFRTLYALLFRPGFLTTEFKAGKRTSYVPPIRLYVFVSFLFFLLLSWGPDTHDQASAASPSADNRPAANEFNLSFAGISSQELRNLNETQIDSLMQVRGIERTTFTRFMARQIKRITSEGRAEFKHRLLKGVSYMMFVLMPICGLLLYLFYRKQAEYYIDGLVFSVHFHAFAFLLFALYILTSRIFDPSLLIFLTPVILTVYLYAGSRSVYRQPRWLTALKTIAVTVLYSASLVACFLVTLLASIALS